MDLSKKSDLWLIRAVKKAGDSDAFVEISNRYRDIYYKICNKYKNRIIGAGLSCDDIFNDKDLIILSCIKSFKPSKKTKLGSWIGNHARYHCLNSINARKHIFPTCDDEIKKSIENSQSYSSCILTDIKNDKSFMVNILNQIKDKRIYEVIKLRYLGDKKPIWAKVAKKMGVSIQTAIGLNQKGLHILKRKMTSKDFMDTI